MLQVASLAHPHLPGSNSHSGQQSHGTDRIPSHAHASGVNVRALMSHLRHGSSSWGPAAMPGSSGSSASSYADVRLASARAGDVAGGISANGNMVRRRRLASEDLDNPWDSSSSTAPESSSHPLAGPSRSLHASAAQSRRGSDATAEASRPALTRLTSETEREVEAAGIASRSSTDGGSLRGSFDLLRTALKPAGEVEVLVHQVSIVSGRQRVGQLIVRAPGQAHRVPAGHSAAVRHRCERQPSTRPDTTIQLTIPSAPPPSAPRPAQDQQTLGIRPRLAPARAVCSPRCVPLDQDLADGRTGARGGADHSRDAQAAAQKH